MFKMTIFHFAHFYESSTSRLIYLLIISKSIFLAKSLTMDLRSQVFFWFVETLVTAETRQSVSPPPWENIDFRIEGTYSQQSF